MSNVKAWIMQIRGPFLVLTPISVLVGVSVAVWEGHSINALYLVLALIGAMLAHIAVNVINEYFDYKSGIDFKTIKTPFSGGSGILVEGLLSPRTVYVVGILCIAAIIAIGAYFISVYGAAIIPIGVLGIITIYFYTTHITKSPFLCAIAPGLGFGPLMIMGTYFVLTGGYSLAAGLASITPAFLVSNLLLINQFPDVEADATAARRHLPIVIGRKNSAVVYTVFLICAYVALIVSVATEVLPYWALLGLITLPLGFAVIKGANQYYDQIEQLIPTLGRNVMLTLFLPLLMAIGVFVG